MVRRILTLLKLWMAVGTRFMKQAKLQPSWESNLQPRPITYWVYEDIPTSRARIHKETCKYVINRKPNPLPDNWWSGPYKNKARAWGKVLAARRSDVGECKICRP